MRSEISSNTECQRSLKKYKGVLHYLEEVGRSGKIKSLTRSQLQAIRSRLSRCLSTIRKYLKLGAVIASLSAIAFNETDAQCRMNRLPLSNQATFATTRLYPSPAFADVDNDGDFDLILHGDNDDVHTYLNDNGFFRREYGNLNPFKNIDPGSDTQITFVDIDNDGDEDAFIGDPNGDIFYYRNDNGDFIEVTGAAHPLSGVDVGDYASPTFIDIDDDSDLDAFVGVSDGTVHFLRNNNGTFSEVMGSGNPLNAVDVGDYASPAFVDIDEDGDPDVFIGDRDGVIHFFKNTNGGFSELTGTANPLNGVVIGDYTAPAFVDIDNDGDPDVFIGGGDGKMQFFTNTNGAFNINVLSGSGRPLDELDPGSRCVPTFGDLDDDGDDDVYLGNGQGTIRSYRNINGTFIELTGSSNPFDGIDVGSNSNPLLVNIDGTNELDLVVGNRDGVIRYYQNTNGSFLLSSGIIDPFLGIDVGYNAAPSFTDFDGDGDLDAFVGSFEGDIRYFRNDPNAISNPVFVEVSGEGNPCNGIDVGFNASPVFPGLNRDRMFVGAEDGSIKEFIKVGSKYMRKESAPIDGVNVGRNASPTFADVSSMYAGEEIVLGNNLGAIFILADQGGRSNAWNGPPASNWHGHFTNWELMTIPESGCDNVHVLKGSVLDVDPSFIAQGRTLTIKGGGQLEVKSGAELLIEPE